MRRNECQYFIRIFQHYSESLCSLSSCSAGSVADGGSSGVMVDELVGADGCRCICVLPTSSGFWVCLALLFHRLVRISIHLSDDEELIRRWVIITGVVLRPAKGVSISRNRKKILAEIF